MEIAVSTFKEACNVSIKGKNLIFEHGLYSRENVPVVEIFPDFSNPELTTISCEGSIEELNAVAVQKGPFDCENDYGFLCHYRSAIKGELEGWVLRKVKVYPSYLALYYHQSIHYAVDYDQVILIRDVKDIVFSDNSGQKIELSGSTMNDGKATMKASLFNAAGWRTAWLYVAEAEDGVLVKRIYGWSDEEASDKRFKELAMCKLRGNDGTIGWRYWTL